MRPLICGLIHFYQMTVRRLAPRCCRFYPSCSDYALEAIQKFGICKGGLKTAGRLLRCNPFTPGGYDSVK